MRKLKFFLLPLCFITLSFTSCENFFSGYMPFSGQVELSPSVAQNGDVVQFSVHPLVIDLGSSTIIHSSSITVNGKSPIKSIAYYIDDVEVARSTEEDSFYEVECKIEGLSTGSHVVTAHCIPRFGYEIDENIKNATLEIKE